MQRKLNSETSHYRENFAKIPKIEHRAFPARDLSLQSQSLEREIKNRRSNYTPGSHALMYTQLYRVIISST